MNVIFTLLFSFRSVAVQLLGREEDRVNFERGIDPDVDDPTKVHRHSSCLEEWPSHTEYEAHDKEVEAAMKVKAQKSGMTSDVLMAIEHCAKTNYRLHPSTSSY